MRSLRSTPASPVDAANYGVPCRGPRWPLRAECLVIISLPMATSSLPPALSGNPTVSDLTNARITSNKNQDAPSVTPEVSLIETLEPYVPPRAGLPLGRGRGRPRGRGGAGQRNNASNTEYPPLNKTVQPSKRFFTMKSTDPNIENIWSHLDTIKANRELEKTIKGAPKRITELKNGSLLIETANPQQSQKIQQIKKLCQIPVDVSEHKTLNYTKGTIRSQRFANEDEDSLLEELSKYNVTEIYKVKRKINETLENTGTIILTFDSCNIPEEVKIGWTVLEVRKYYPNPRQCYKCQKFNHSSKTCRSPVEICNRCGEAGHSGHSCENPLNCANCDEPHKSNDKNCFLFKLEKEIIALQTNEKMGYRDAKKKILKTFVQPNLTYADALKDKLKNRPRTNTRNPQSSESNTETREEQRNQHTPHQLRTSSEPSENATQRPQTNEETNALHESQQSQEVISNKKRDISSESENEVPKKKQHILPAKGGEEPMQINVDSTSSKTLPPPSAVGRNTVPKNSLSLSQPPKGSMGTSSTAKTRSASSDKRGTEKTPAQTLSQNPTPQKHPPDQTNKLNTIPSLGNYYRSRSNSFGNPHQS